MYQDVHGSPRAVIPPLVESRVPVRSIQALERAVMTLYRAFEAWRERQAAVRELQKLDEHLLLDVGIERREIPEIVARQADADRR